MRWSYVERGNTYLQSQHWELKQDHMFKGSLDFTGRRCVKLTRWSSQELLQTWFLCRAAWYYLNMFSCWRLLILCSWYLLKTEAYFFKDLFIFVFVSMLGLLACRSMYHMNGVHRRGHQIPQNESYRLLWAVMWVMANGWATLQTPDTGRSLQNWKNMSNRGGINIWSK